MNTSETERAKEIDEAVKAADAKKRADAEEEVHNGEKLDNILKCLDSLGKRMDAFEKKPAEDDPLNSGEDLDAPRPLGADSVRKDSADAEEIDNYKREAGSAYVGSPAVVLAEIQTQADKAASAWGRDAKHPWDGEEIVAYRRRVAREHQRHSPAWRDVDLGSLSGQSLRNATAQIFADSIRASEAQTSYGEDELREVRRRDPISGQTRIEFYGNPAGWTNQFKTGPMRVVKFKTGARYDGD